LYVPDDAPRFQNISFQSKNISIVEQRDLNQTKQAAQSVADPIFLTGLDHVTEDLVHLESIMERRTLILGGLVSIGSAAANLIFGCEASSDASGSGGEGSPPTPAPNSTRSTPASRTGASTTPLQQPPLPAPAASPSCFSLASDPATRLAIEHLAWAQTLIQIYDLAVDIWANRELIVAAIDSIKQGNMQPLAEVLEVALVEFAQDWAIESLKQEVLTEEQRLILENAIGAAECAANLPKCVIEFIWGLIAEELSSQFKIASLREAIESFRTLSTELQAAIDSQDEAQTIAVLNLAIQAFERIIVVAHASVHQMNVPRLWLVNKDLRRFLTGVGDGRFGKIYDLYKDSVLALSGMLEADINALAEFERACDVYILCGNSSMKQLLDGTPLPADWEDRRCVATKGRHDAEVNKRCYSHIRYVTKAQKDLGQGCPGMWTKCCDAGFAQNPPRYHIEKQR
jgi:hypothetical protein